MPSLVTHYQKQLNAGGSLGILIDKNSIKLKFIPGFNPSKEKKDWTLRVVPSAMVGKWTFGYVNTYDDRIFWPKWALWLIVDGTLWLTQWGNSSWITHGCSQISSQISLDNDCNWLSPITLLQHHVNCLTKLTTIYFYFICLLGYCPSH